MTEALPALLWFTIAAAGLSIGGAAGSSFFARTGLGGACGSKRWERLAAAPTQLEVRRVELTAGTAAALFADDGRGADDPLHLIVEVKGLKDNQDTAKADTATAMWLHALPLIASTTATEAVA